MKSIYDISDGIFVNVKDVHDLYCAVSEFLNGQGIKEPHIVKDVENGKVIVTYPEVPADFIKFNRELKNAKELYKKHHTKEAAAHLLSLKNEFPYRSAIYRLLSRIELGQHKYQEARQYCDMAIKVDPKDLRSIVFKGNLYYYEAQIYDGTRHEELIKLAIDHYDWALSIDEECLEALINKMSILSADPAQREALSLVIADKPHVSLSAYMALAMAYYRECLNVKKDENGNYIYEQRHIITHLKAFEIIHKGIIKYKEECKGTSLLFHAVQLLKDISRKNDLDLFYKYGFVKEYLGDPYKDFIEVINKTGKWKVDIDYCPPTPMGPERVCLFLSKINNRDFNNWYHPIINHPQGYNRYWQIKVLRDLYKVRFDIEEDNYGGRNFVINKKHRNLVVEKYGNDIYSLLKPHNIKKRDTRTILEYLHHKYTQKVMDELLNVYIDNIIFQEYPQLRYFLFGLIDITIGKLDSWNKIWELPEFKFVSCPSILKMLRMHQLKELFSVELFNTSNDATNQNAHDANKKGSKSLKEQYDLAEEMYNTIKEFDKGSPYQLLAILTGKIMLGDNNALSNFVELLSENELKKLAERRVSYSTISLLPYDYYSTDQASSRSFHIEDSYEKYFYSSTKGWPTEKIDKPKDDIRFLVSRVKLKNEIFEKWVHGIKPSMTMKEIMAKNPPFFIFFEGNPGTSKSIIAEHLSRLYFSFGILKTSKFYRNDIYRLVGKDADETLKNATYAFHRAIDGTLYIDLSRRSYSPLSKELVNHAISTILDNALKIKNRIVVILGGNNSELKELADCNSAVKALFDRRLCFPDYSADELVKIFEHMANEDGYYLTDDAVEAVRELMEEAVSEVESNFNNAVFVERVFFLTRDYQANRGLGLDHSQCIEDYYVQDLDKYADLPGFEDIDGELVIVDSEIPDNYIENEIRAEDIPDFSEVCYEAVD